MIPYGKQNITEEDIRAVEEVLRSDFLTQGPVVPLFEKAIENYCNVTHAIAVNSATSALHLSCLALGLTNGDWLWTTPNSFVASANCGLYCGAHVDFVDIDPDTYNLCPDKLEEKLNYADKNNNLPKVVVAVHFAGQSCDMKRIRYLADKYGFRIIEDASHAIGGKYLDKPVGNCQYSDITVFSFHPVKIITTGEGGVVTTNDKEIARKILLLRSHGITRDTDLMTQTPDGDWYYQQVALGFNYRMTDIQAALGKSQINRLDAVVEKRHKLKSRYDLLLDDLPVKTPAQMSYAYSAMHLYPVLLKRKELSKTRSEIFHDLRERGVGVNVHYIPIHLQPYYSDQGFEAGDFPVAEEYYENEITIPLYETLTQNDQDYVVSALSEVLG